MKKISKETYIEFFDLLGENEEHMGEMAAFSVTAEMLGIEEQQIYDVMGEYGDAIPDEESGFISTETIGGLFEGRVIQIKALITCSIKWVRKAITPSCTDNNIYVVTDRARIKDHSKYKRKKGLHIYKIDFDDVIETEIFIRSTGESTVRVAMVEVEKEASREDK